MPYNAINREATINSLDQGKFDILIIGGGITGAGIALDAVSRGFRVALIEKGDFASGTSSKSTKLIHGGLRYLKNMEFKLVRDTGLERAVAFRNAPHLVRPEKMLLPLIERGAFGKIAISFGLWLYDILAWVRKEDRRIMLSKKRTLALEPLLRKDIVKGAGYYSEYRTDDARLTVEVLKTAAQKGATIINYVKAIRFIYQYGKITGIDAEDSINNQSISVNAKYIINATGPWVDILRKKDNSLKDKHLYLTKGVHIVVSKLKFPLQQSVYFDVDDGRMIFAIPRLDITYIGTTDTFYDGDLETPEVNKNDVNYLLNAVNNMFPTVNLSAKDIISSWAGLRPLIYEEGKGPSELSRSDELFESESGLITIAGGKLTGYRLMAKKVVRLICDKEGIIRKCKTRRIRLCGADFKRTRDIKSYIKTVEDMLEVAEINPEKANYMIMNYGTQSEEIIELFVKQKHKRLTCAEAEFAIKKEGVCHLDDFFVRRTGKLLFEPTSIAQELDSVVLVFVKYLRWKKEQQISERERIIKQLENCITFV